MSDNNDDSEINIPPIKLPEPDPFDTSKSNEGKDSFMKKGKKSKKKKGRHPTDKYKDVRREKKGMGCCGTIGCLGLLAILLILGAVGFCSYVMFGDAKGYNVVQLESVDEVIVTPPAEPTFYIGQGNVTYNVPETPVPIMILAGKKAEISGKFADKLSIRAAEVVLRGGSHCRGDLNVYAVKYIDEGMQVDGQKSGKMLQ